ncbi:MAG TPA: hypothetical protein VG867_02960 [Rhizomicrobium sp.]|nr:hypothetical protein [Rhizomicrobium sp.]
MSYALIGAYVTPDAPEMAASVPMNKQKIVVMSLAVGDVMAGDVLQVNAEMQATNNASQWALFARSIVLADGPAATAGQMVTEQNGENFNPNNYWIGRCDVHHLVAVKAQIVIASKAYATGYLNFLAWANTDPPAPQLALTVDKGYGRMSALKFRQ